MIADATVPSALWAALGLGLLAAAVFWLAGSLAGRLRHPARQLRRIVVFGLPTAGLIAYVLLSLADAGAVTRDALAAGSEALAASVVGVFAAQLTTALLAVLVAAVGFLATLPAARDVRGLEMWDTASGLLRYMVVAGVLLAAVLAAVVLTVSGDVLGSFVVLVGLAVALLASAPRLTRLVRSSRAPTAAERDRIEELRESADLDVADVVVLEATATRTAQAYVRGLPGRRTLFVTDYFLESLDDEAATAILAAEAGLADVWFLEYRTFAAALVGGLILVGIGYRPGVWYLLFLGGVALVLLWGGRQLRLRADEAAAARVGGEVLAIAIERVADLHDVQPGRGRTLNAFKMRPSLGRRIDRIRKQNG